MISQISCLTIFLKNIWFNTSNKNKITINKSLKKKDTDSFDQYCSDGNLDKESSNQDF